MIAILERLGFELEEATEEEEPTWDVLVPYWRDGDVQREADLIEEVARDARTRQACPTTLPERPLAVGRLTHEQRTRRRLEDALRDRGLTETIKLELHVARGDGGAAPRETCRCCGWTTRSARTRA